MLEPGQHAVAGGHAVHIHGYDQNWLFFNTWGQRMPMSWELFSTICDQAYGLLSRDWLTTRGVSPANEDFASPCAELQAACAA